MSDLEDSFSDGELSYLCQKALFVQPASRIIDLNTVPADGNEFIHKVRLENLLVKFAKVNSHEEFTPLTDKEVFEADKVWKRRAAAEFAYFSNKLKTDKEILKQKHPQTVAIPLDDEIECCIFCLGSEKCSKIYECSPGSSVKGHLPLLNYVIHLNQVEIQKLLKYSFKWYRSAGMDLDISRWIFSFLACTEKPLPHNLEQFLEDNFDDCRLHLKNCEEEEYKRVHLIMSLLENYFCVKSCDHGAYFNHIFY